MSSSTNKANVPFKVLNNFRPPQLTADVAGYVPDRRECVWLLDLPETHGVIRPEPVMPAEIATENIIQSAVAPEEPVPSELNSLAAEYSQPMETVSRGFMFFFFQLLIGI